MYFFLKYIVTLFYKKLRIKIVVCLLRESGPWQLFRFMCSRSELKITGKLIVQFYQHNDSLNMGGLSHHVNARSSRWRIVLE